MPEPPSYPYATHLNVLYAPLEVVEVQKLVDAYTHPWYNQELLPRQGFTVPRGVVHRTRAPERCVVLMVEAATVVPTGD